MNAADVKELLTTDDVIDLLHELGADPVRKGNEVYCRTICHHGNKKKLVYYTDSKTFSCFTDSCGHGFDLFILIQKVFGIDFPSSFKYICGKYNISSDYGEWLPADHVDTTFIRKFKKKEPQYILEEISKNLLNSFYKMFHKTWVEDNISIRSMIKFGILFSIKDNKIIIPHFDINGRLLGIRGRALNQDEIDAGKKYMPIFHKGIVRKHPTGANIYGLNVTQEQVKKHKTIILFESEKGPQQLDTMFPEISIGGGISGSSLTDEQVKILLSLGIENVVIALDKEFEEVGSQEETFYKKKIKSGFIDKLLPYFHVSIIWDSEGLLDLKDSPTDKGKDIFLELFNKKIVIS